MASQDGAPGGAVESLLCELNQEPYRFDFYQAMRLLEAAFQDAPRFGYSLRLADEPIRLSQEPSLKFAPASLSAFRAGNAQRPPQLGVQFFGLCGPNGALPLHITEYIRDRIKHHDDNTLEAFLNIFHHRLLSLFYRAWADAQPTVHHDRPKTDRFAVYVGSLLGIGSPTLSNRDAFPDLAKLYYAGQMAPQTHHPDGLRAIIEDFFDLPVSIQEFVGQWTEVPEGFRFRAGEVPQSATLGVACTLGSHVWDCQQKFRLTIGPIGWQDFRRMLPGGQSLERLTALVRNYVGDELMWEVNLVLKHSETPGWRLGEQQLGRSIWVDNGGVEEDSADVVLHPQQSSG